MPTLTIQNLKVAIDERLIINSLNLTIGQGETHAIMGPNGSGKSTLAQTLLAHPKYKVLGGQIKFDQLNLRELSPDKIANAGIMLAFQYPLSIPGVSVANLLKLATAQKNQGQKKLGLPKFLENLKAKITGMQMPEEFLSRSLNEGFSGGEKKKAEILQLAMLKPKLAILDETDSGLDIDSLKIVASEINRLKKQGVSILMITHYNRILKYVKPDFVHIMYRGRIVKSSNRDLAEEIEKSGYEKLLSTKQLNK